MKVGFMGLYITRTCFCDAILPVYLNRLENDSAIELLNI